MHTLRILTLKTTQKLSEPISKYSKVAEYKINIQKLVAFLFINNKLSENIIKKTISFSIATK